MSNTRRSFVYKFLMLSPFFAKMEAFASPSSSPKKKHFSISFTTVFPHNMKKHEWDEYKAKNSQGSEIKQQLRKFKDQGLLIKEGSAFLGHSSRWDLVFRDEAAYKLWVKSTSQKKLRKYDGMKSFETITN